MASKWDKYVWHETYADGSETYFVADSRDGRFYWKPLDAVRRVNPSVRASFGPLSVCPWRYASRRAALAAARRQYVVEA